MRLVFGPGSVGSAASVLVCGVGPTAIVRWRLPPSYREPAFGRNRGWYVRVRALRMVRLSSLLMSIALAGGAASASAGTYCVQDPACVAAGGALS